MTESVFRKLDKNIDRKEEEMWDYTDNSDMDLRAREEEEEGEKGEGRREKRGERKLKKEQRKS